MFDRELGVFLAVLEHENAQRHVGSRSGLHFIEIGLEKGWHPHRRSARKSAAQRNRTRAPATIG
jgi:hypothetical protein